MKTAATEQKKAAAHEILIQKLEELEPKANRHSVVKEFNSTSLSYWKEHNAVSSKKSGTVTHDSNRLNSSLADIMSVLKCLLHSLSHELNSSN